MSHYESDFRVKLILIQISANVHVNEILFALVHRSPRAILLGFVHRLLSYRCLALFLPDALVRFLVHGTVDVCETHFLPDYNPVYAT